MGAPPLVMSDIEAGKELVKALDGKGIGVRAAFWLWVPEASEWRLELVMPLVDREGPRAGYRVVNKVLASREASLGALYWKISVAGPRETLPRRLRSAVKTGRRALAELRLTQTIVGGAVIEDAYVYRSY